ncbi:MAG TPA: hypothetical protein VK363_18385 [Pyrinomonadaceae bacterium]|nr:hypothetical protein [Pyrinomonadaceae bacterium]
MNAAGMIFALTGVSAVLNMPFYQSLVTDGKVSQEELDGTRHNISSAIATLKNTPTEKLEALVAQNDEELTAYLNKFNAIGQEDLLGGLRNAQIMAGYVTTIMSKSGIRG